MIRQAVRQDALQDRNGINGTAGGGVVVFSGLSFAAVCPLSPVPCGHRLPCCFGLLLCESSPNGMVGNAAADKPPGVTMVLRLGEGTPSHQRVFVGEWVESLARLAQTR